MLELESKDTMCGILLLNFQIAKIELQIIFSLILHGVNNISSIGIFHELIIMNIYFSNSY